MSGHSQNRLPPTPRTRCPKCGKKGVGDEKKHWAHGALHFIRSCRYCHHNMVYTVHPTKE